MCQKDGIGKDVNHQGEHWEGEAGGRCCIDPLRKQGGGRNASRIVAWESGLR